MCIKMGWRIFEEGVRMSSIVGGASHDLDFWHVTCTKGRKYLLISILLRSLIFSFVLGQSIGMNFHENKDDEDEQSLFVLYFRLPRNLFYLKQLSRFSFFQFFIAGEMILNPLLFRALQSWDEREAESNLNMSKIEEAFETAWWKILR